MSAYNVLSLVHILTHCLQDIRLYAFTRTISGEVYRIGNAD